MGWNKHRNRLVKGIWRARSQESHGVNLTDSKESKIEVRWEEVDIKVA